MTFSSLGKQSIPVHAMVILAEHPWLNIARAGVMKVKRNESGSQCYGSDDENEGA
jgi:hypothetical protein